MIDPVPLLPLIAPQCNTHSSSGAHDLPELTGAERARYARHLRLSPIGELGQRRLKAARVALVGAGGLGSPIGLYLAAAGVGTIGIIDADTVDTSNLQRQIAHTTAQEGNLKVDSAASAMTALNPHINVVRHAERLERHNAVPLLSNYDLVLDGSDNFATRYLVDTAAASLRMPLVWGAVLSFDGQVSVFWERSDLSDTHTDYWLSRPGVTYRDLHPEPPQLPVQNCAEAGVLGALCGHIGSLMATQAIQLLCGFGSPLLGRVAIVDALTSSTEILPVQRSARPTTPRAVVSHDAMHETPLPSELTASELVALLEERAAGLRTFELIDIREPHEWCSGVIAGAQLVPMNEIAADPQQFAADVPLIFTCAAGVRSANLIDYLRLRLPEAQLSHLSVGMHGWSGAVVPPA